MTPTPEQIQAEIKWLRENKSKVRHYSAFGDNHHDSIDSQITTLEEKLDEDGIEAAADEEGWAEGVKSSALQAYYWTQDDKEISPSKDWASLVKI